MLRPITARQIIPPPPPTNRSAPPHLPPPSLSPTAHLRCHSPFPAAARFSRRCRAAAARRRRCPFAGAVPGHPPATPSSAPPFLYSLYGILLIAAIATSRGLPRHSGDLVLRRPRLPARCSASPPAMAAEGHLAPAPLPPSIRSQVRRAAFLLRLLARDRVPASSSPPARGPATAPVAVVPCRWSPLLKVQLSLGGFGNS